MTGRSVAIAGVVLWLLISACGTAPVSAPATHIRVVDPLEATNIHVFIADRNGYFQRHGLAADINYVSSAKAAMDALNGKGADYAGVVDMVVAQSLFRTTNIAILSEVSQHIHSLKVLGRTDAGIHSGRDLAGRKVGVLFGVSAQRFFLKYLSSIGLDASRVKMQNLQPPEADAAFRSGSIDAVVTWQPHVYRLMHDPGLQNKVVVITDDDSLWPNILLLATRRSYLASHTDEAKRFLAAILDADDFIHKEPAQTQSLIAGHLGLTAAEVRSFFDEVEYSVRIRPLLLQNLAGDVEWQSKEFQSGKSPLTTDFASLIAPQLHELRPAAAMAGNWK